VTTRPTRNVAASVRQRLLNLAKERGEEFNLVLARYAVERFLYRLSRSKHRDRFVLKGATLIQAWGASRADRDHEPTTRKPREPVLRGAERPAGARRDLRRGALRRSYEVDGFSVEGRDPLSVEAREHLARSRVGAATALSHAGPRLAW
jgi:hypothetical protein